VIRAAILAICLTGCAHVCSEPKVPEHTHQKAELGLSCAETCAPGRCDSSYDISAQKEIPCDQDAERYALCICRAP
jgi:hypothetical protein